MWVNALVNASLPAPSCSWNVPLGRELPSLLQKCFIHRIARRKSEGGEEHEWLRLEIAAAFSPDSSLA